jgi:hypothetical protein
MTRGKAAACLRGVTVLLTGFSDQTRQELQQLVVDLGGNCTLDCSISPQPDVLVSPSVNSSKYKVSGPAASYLARHVELAVNLLATVLLKTSCLAQATVAAQPDIPTHTADWLKACERTKSKVKAAQQAGKTRLPAAIVTKQCISVSCVSGAIHRASPCTFCRPGDLHKWLCQEKGSDGECYQPVWRTI